MSVAMKASVSLNVKNHEIKIVSSPDVRKKSKEKHPVFHEYLFLVYTTQVNRNFRAPCLASSEVISQVLFTSHKMAFVGILSQIKLVFGSLVIQLVWYILKQLLLFSAFSSVLFLLCLYCVSCNCKFEDCYLCIRSQSSRISVGRHRTCNVARFRRNI